MKAPSGLAPLEPKFWEVAKEEENAGARGNVQGASPRADSFALGNVFPFATIRLNFLSRGARPRGPGISRTRDADNYENTLPNLRNRVFSQPAIRGLHN